MFGISTGEFFASSASACCHCQCHVDDGSSIDEADLLPLCFNSDEVLDAYRKGLRHAQNEEKDSMVSPVACPLSLEKLRPVLKLPDLELGQRFQGRALYGVLCAKAFPVYGAKIMTCLRDEAGNVARVCVKHDGHSVSCKEAQDLYPKGTKVAITEPLLKCSRGGLPFLRVLHSLDLVKVENGTNGSTAASLSQLTHLRSEGNICFSLKDWEGAVSFYTQCVDIGRFMGPELLEMGGEVSYCLVLAYSNRSEAWMKLGAYDKALADSEEALKIDSGHVKSMAQAVKGADLTAFLLGGCKSHDAPKCDEYVGPVEIRESIDCHGRGLFAKSDVKAGELLLVSNALAMCPVNLDTDECAHSRKVSPKALKDVAKKVTEAAKTSWRLVQQLRTLCGGSLSTPMALEVPSMELFTQAWPPNDSKEGNFNSLDTDVNVD
ncbi:hypothetical protein L7F22_036642 [Adiantum nelumboides]|nr:hypothetical protein [Adiantum nelumboides]